MQAYALHVGPFDSVCSVMLFPFSSLFVFLFVRPFVNSVMSSGLSCPFLCFDHLFIPSDRPTVRPSFIIEVVCRKS